MGYPTHEKLSTGQRTVKLTAEELEYHWDSDREEWGFGEVKIGELFRFTETDTDSGMFQLERFDNFGDMQGVGDEEYEWGDLPSEEDQLGEQTAIYDSKEGGRVIKYVLLPRKYFGAEGSFYRNEQGDVVFEDIWGEVEEVGLSMSPDGYVLA